MVSDQKKRILVIEDDADIRTVLVTRLMRAGYETIVGVRSVNNTGANKKIPGPNAPIKPTSLKNVIC